MEIYTAYQTKNGAYNFSKPIEPVGIIVHSTGVNNAYLRRYVDAPEICGQSERNWNNEKTAKMVHAFIGKDAAGDVKIIQTLPFSFAAWGCGSGANGSYNYAPNGHIQFEICENTGDADYTVKAYNMAVDFCAYLCKKFKLPPTSIISHKEAAARGYASRHQDPEHWFNQYGKTMADFRREVAEKINEKEVVIMGKVVSADALKAWIDENAHDETPAEKPGFQPGERVKFKRGVTRWGASSGNKTIASWALDGKTVFKVLRVLHGGRETAIGNDAGQYSGTAYTCDLERA